MKFIKYAPLVIFGLFALKTLIMGCTIENALTLAILGSIAAYYEWKNESAIIQAFEFRLVSYEEKLDNSAKELENLKTHVGGLRIGQNLRTTNGIGRG